MVKRLVIHKHNPAQLKVINFAATPLTSNEGDRYIVQSGTGDFDGEDNNIAWRYDGDWHFDTPDNGWTAWVEEEGATYVFNGKWAKLRYEQEATPDPDEAHKDSVWLRPSDMKLFEIVVDTDNYWAEISSPKIS